MSPVTVRASAKVNLSLRVGPVRLDGFHPLATVYQSIGLYDDVTVTPADSWSIRTTADAFIDLAGVPDDASNLAVRAGQALTRHHGVELAVHLDVHKGIPVAGGLAGGSADAAAALVAVDRLFDLRTSDDDLLAIAATLGSDVPFALIGGTATGLGRGEQVERIGALATLWWLVVPHEIGLSTPAVYRHFDVMAARGQLVPEAAVLSASLLAALTDGDGAAVIDALANDLTAPAYTLRPDLRERAAWLSTLTGGVVLLSGSGPTQLVPFVDVDEARTAARRLSREGVAHWLAPGSVAGTHVMTGR